MKKIFILVFLIMFLIGTDTFLVSPLLPTLTETYGISASISGWLVSAYALGYALFALISGPISDRLDRKKVMVSGLIAFSLSTFACGLAPTFQTMLLCRFLAGVSASFVTPQVWASIPIIVEPKNIVKTMGYASAGLSISQLVGIPIGSYLASYTWHTPFFTIATFSLLLLILITILFPSIKAQQGVDKEPLSLRKTYSGLLGTKGVVKYLFAYFVFQTGTFTSFTFIGSWFTKDFGLALSGVGTAMIAIGLGNTIGSLYGNRIVKKLGEAKTLLFALPVLVILYIVLPFVPNLLLAEIVLFVIFLTNGCIFPVLMAMLQSFTTTARGTASSLSNAAMYAGTTLGGIIGGFLFAGVTGFSGVSIFTAVIYFISISLFYSSGVFHSIKTKKTER